MASTSDALRTTAIRLLVGRSRSGGCFGCCRSAGTCIAAKENNFIIHPQTRYVSCTHSLLPFPSLHRRFILLKFMAPIRVDLLVIVALRRGRASVSVDRDVIRAQQRSAHPAIVPPRISFRHGDNHQPVLRSFYVLLRPENDLVPSFLLRVVVPGDGLRGKNRRHLQETTEVEALPPRDDHTFLNDAAVANVHGAVRNVLQQTGRVCLASVDVLVPAAVRVVNAP